MRNGKMNKYAVLDTNQKPEGRIDTVNGKIKTSNQGLDTVEGNDRNRTYPGLNTVNGGSNRITRGLDTVEGEMEKRKQPEL